MGSIVSGLTGKTSKKGQQALEKVNPVSFSTSGLSGTYNPARNLYSVNSSASRDTLYRGLFSTFENQAKDLGNARDLVKPGFGAITDARVNTIRDRSRSAIGDLASNLQQRRVLGSSFGQDALARAKKEFAREEADAKAQSFLEELDMTINLINQESSAAANSFQSIIDKMNIEASMASQLSTQATQTLSGIAQARANLYSEQASGSGSLFGTLIGTGIKAYGISQDIPTV